MSMLVATPDNFKPSENLVFTKPKVKYNTNVNITLISRGIGVGNQLEYIDELTLGKSLLDRSVYKTNITN